MYRTGLLWHVKFKMIYHSVAAVILTCLLIALIGALTVSYWMSHDNTIRIYVVPEEETALSEAFLNARSDRIEVVKTTFAEGQKGLKEYKAEAMIVIPVGAEDKIRSGERKKVFALYYLSGNPLAPFLADRMISNVFAQIYDLAGEQLIAQVYRKEEIAAPEARIADFHEQIRELRKEMDKGYYFTISFDEKKLIKIEQSDAGRYRDNQGKLTELGILVAVCGINFIFLLYFGLKLLSERQKNDRIRLAGFGNWHIWTSDALILLFPQGILFALLLPFALYFAAFGFWLVMLVVGMISVICNLLMIRIIRLRQFYFPIGIGIYLIGIVICLNGFRHI